MKNKDEYVKLGAQLPKGILLVGSPGVGKTLLSKAIAGEADCDFTYISSSSVEGRTIGQGAAKIREIFAKAKKSPGMTIIFFDEFDSIATKRSAMDEAWGRQTLNQLLSEMDGFDKHSNVFIIAATNFPQGLDPAVVRPGRFDKVISIPMPSFRSRKEIAQYYLSKIPASNDIDSEFIARNTINMSGADIKSLVNLAAMNAAKLSRSIVTKDDFEFAFDRIHVGILNKSITPNEHEKYMTAVHEAGHAMVSLLNPHATRMHKVTILSKGQALGLVYQLYLFRSSQRRISAKQGQNSRVDGCRNGRASGRRDLFWKL